MDHRAGPRQGVLAGLAISACRLTPSRFCFKFGMAGQTLGAMCSARDEIERLQGLLTWCRPRLRHHAYRMRLDAAMDGQCQELDHTQIEHSENNG